MRSVQLEIPTAHYRHLLGHLLCANGESEQAAFLYARAMVSECSATFQFLGCLLVQPRQFAIQSEFHLELDDRTRAKVIKTAHDLQCSLVELHSHPASDIAMFSWSDFCGLKEFVPHVWWRLKNRPYAALVVARQSVDGLAWLESPEKVEPVGAIVVDGQILGTTGLSYNSMASAKS